MQFKIHITEVPERKNRSKYEQEKMLADIMDKIFPMVLKKPFVCKFKNLNKCQPEQTQSKYIHIKSK